MNEQKIGLFIKQLRTEKNYTQKELAEQLHITDRAVSKWERGLSCPDISLILPLAEILECSTGELLNGERAKEEQYENVETTINKALIYSDRNIKNKLGRIKNYMSIILSVISLLAVLICFICDFCIKRKLSWSLIVAVSLIFSWIVLISLLKAKNKSIRVTLVIISFAIFPYLYILGKLLNEPLVYTLGSVIAVISIIGIWCVYLAFYKLWHRKLCAFGIAFLVAIPISWCINHMVSYYLQNATTGLINDVVNSVSLGIITLICFGVDYMLSHKNTDISRAM